MADLALEHDLDQPSAAPVAHPAEGSVGRSVPSLDGHCHVLPDQPLPALSTSCASAFAAVDPNDSSHKLYALLPDPQLPFRLDAIRHVGDLGDASVVRPVEWGSIDWPLTGRRETLLVFQRPSDEALMPSIDAQFQPLRVPDIKQSLMKPMVELLAALENQRLAHRNIRPNNLFRAGADDPIIAGEFYSAPPGFNQPSIFEPIERAMCPPAGRGAGDVRDDLYALGVTALFLVLGRNPVAHLDDETLLAKRIEMGSYAALTAQAKPPGELAPVIRSLMHDSAPDRCVLDDLARWVDGGVANQAKPVTMARSDRGFEFAEGQHHTRRQLARAFSQNWGAGCAVVLTDEIERWAERSLDDRDLAQQIVDCRHSTDSGPRMISDDLLLARTIITLDPEGPLRFRGISVMPDGIGAFAALAAADADMAGAFKEMISSQLVEFWFEKQAESESPALAGRADAKKVLTYLEKTGPGFGLERCIYELNKGMSCQSPRFMNVNAVNIRELVEALDAGAKKGESQLDRHVAGFLGARYSGSIDAELNEYASARDGEDALVAQLRIFAAVQFKHGPRELPNLASVALSHLDILLSPYRNVALRQHLKHAAKQTAATGRLPELLGVIRNRKTMNTDKRGFDRAKRQYKSLERQVHFHENARARTGDRALVAGRRAAAYLSGLIGAAVVVMVMMAGMT